MASARKQVEADHYFDRSYDTVKRFASYWHQIDLTLRHRPRTVLEIGVGNGFVSGYLRRAGLAVTALDLDSALGPNVVAALPELPFADRSFDTVLCYEVLEHLPFERFGPCLAEIARVARANVAVSLPDYERCLKIDSMLSKLWSVHFVVNVPRLFAPRHPPHREHHWEIGKKGYRQRRILREMVAAGLSIRRHYRALEAPYHHFFDLAKAG